jgi:hypothetical protein
MKYFKICAGGKCPLFSPLNTPLTVPNITAIATRYDGGGDFSQVSVAMVKGNRNQITGR